MSSDRDRDLKPTKYQWTLHVSLLLLALLLLLVARFTSRRHSAEVSPTAFQVPNLTPKYDWSKVGVTAVVAIRDGCHFCEESAPFYRKLVSKEKHQVSRSHVIFVLPDPPALGKLDIPEGAADSQAFYDIPLRSFGIVGTPTILLINDKARIIRVWQGKLTTSEESNLILALR